MSFPPLIYPAYVASGGAPTLRTVHSAFTGQSGSQSYAAVSASWDPSGTATVTFQAQSTNDAGASTTITGAAIGTAAANRKVIVCASAIVAGGTATSGSMTIGGTSATKIIEANGSVDGNTNHAYVGMFALDVSSGTTANIVMTWGGQSSFDGYISVYAAYSLSTLRGTNSFSGGVSGANTATLDVNVLTGSLVIAADTIYALTPLSQTWTGVTQDASGSGFGTDLNACASAIA